ncbi:peptidoglycan bridge formation glycyltransferase FemA/FemB family protein [Streptococcus iniae]|uniref:peptidoglycan bridge formation glycyltransferase FemA/FemB family protein n=1 Tax=Streptococcus iniae TaxID=1346 RepID=UPI000EF7123F|nr:peptidoglycan bridge formation glycyltransferase FemA/FemB family protein [Streptococcus iniae]RLU33358.1 peptidoglycan branched peptide synthesis protein [Streptococcus iniae]RLU37110.1 peptidoglycan branched peptide synthesis protein [Streptococcus iniae]RLU38472.1 peptidoglycan branched peptide synthesis protein [Streptococcus iniae]RLU39225.1 peptidoglycan branched peptide synthesis protein [Streptococcus iniae]
MEIISVGKSEFLACQENFVTSNFLQSYQIFELQDDRGHFDLVESVVFVKDNSIVGLAIIDYRKKCYFFKEALLIQGPVLDYDNTELLSEAIWALEKHVLSRKACRLMCHPYLKRLRLNENLQEIGQVENEATRSLFLKKGYCHSFDPEFLMNGMAQAFIKDLSLYDNSQAISKNYATALCRNIKKYKESCVKIRELTKDEIPIFYDILLKTSDRKQFSVQDIDFFYKMKEVFQEQAKFMMAYLDTEAYLSYLNENCDRLQLEIESLLLKDDSKKRNTAIKNAQQQLTSFQKRRDEYNSMFISEAFLPLSSYLFIEYGDELISYAGGNLEDYLIFGGATLINAHMIAYAKNNAIKYFNFGGTIETSKSKQGIGNFKFKKQFGGELVQFLGSFTKSLNTTGKLLTFYDRYFS